jgi:endonuclease/exonuclease/phosphatase (EEP) superfamily protein YafD
VKRSDLVLAVFRPFLVLVSLLVIGRIVAWDATMVQVWFDTFVPYWFIPVDAALLAALLVRRYGLAAAAALLVVVQLWLTLPGSLWASANPADLAARAPLRVMSVNLLGVNAQTAPITDEIAVSGADIIALQEYSPQWQAALSRPDLLARYPHRLEHPRSDSFGMAILSALPFASSREEDLEGVPLGFVEVDVGKHRLTLADVHTLPPARLDYFPVWTEQMASLRDRLAAIPGPLVLAGDLNATVWHAPFQALVARRLRDAHVDRGRSLAFTWPNGVFPLPPTRLDHLLVSPEIAVVSITEGTGAGSDHKPLLATLAL